MDLPVHYEDRLVATISADARATRLAYADAWTSSAESFPVSLAMPIRPEPYDGDQVLPWLMNLLPEGEPLRAMTRALGAAPEDALGLIAQTGNDLAGALSIALQQPRGKPGYRPIPDAGALQQIIEELPARPFLVGEDGVSMSLAGAQEKLPVAVIDGQIAVPINGAPSTHILKPDNPRLPGSVQNEALCMVLARRIGLNVAPVTTGVAGERSYLLVERYDRAGKRAVVKATPQLSDFVETHWDDLSRVWKASTTKRNWNAWRSVLAPEFGAMRVADILPADIHRWRDGCAGAREGLFNRALPVLAALLKYAEALRLRRKGSNPCRGMPRYWQEPKERYLTPAEYLRIGAALREEKESYPAQVAIVRLLLFTGARVGEIQNLRWEWVQPPRLLLPDSKTGAKTIWLNSQSLEVLDGIERRADTSLVFPNRSGAKPVILDNWWFAFRRRCALPDVRVHDLRHSFASTAIMDNVPLATIGKLLGHVLPETTAKYAHLSDDVIGDAADRISGSLARAIGLRP